MHRTVAVRNLLFMQCVLQNIVTAAIQNKQLVHLRGRNRASAIFKDVKILSAHVSADGNGQSTDEEM